MAAKRGNKTSKPVVQPVAGPPTRPGQPGGKRDQVRRARTEQLCGAALHLFLDQGLETTTIDEITQEAGVSKGSFYRYFKDKEALVRHLFSPLHQEVDEAMRVCTQSIRAAPDASQAYVAYVQVGVALAGILSRHRSVLLLYLRESRSAAIGHPGEPTAADRLRSVVVGDATAAVRLRSDPQDGRPQPSCIRRRRGITCWVLSDAAGGCC